MGEAITFQIFTGKSVGMGKSMAEVLSTARGWRTKAVLETKATETDRLPTKYLARNGLAHYQIFFNTVVEQ